jgi:pimeloyl-ACP methyl ester carboxylesterase
MRTGAYACLLLALAVGVAAPSSASAESATKTVWLCRADSGPCGARLTSTVVEADGSTTIERARRARRPPINCFYVYPTVSEQKTPNANLKIEATERAVAELQASRFTQDCEVYAPMYPQMTLKSINEPISLEAAGKAYAGVLDAWDEFISRYDDGRGVVLIGHSQGALMLTELLKNQIDPNPEVRKLLVSALLLGGNVLVPEGQLVGGDFHNIPACQAASETHCVIAYSTFLKEPPEGAYFGRPASPKDPLQPPPGSEVLCVNPTLEVQNGSAGALLPYEQTRPYPGAFGALYGELPTARTPWVSSVGEYTAQCHKENGASWLQVNPVGPALDPGEYVQELLGADWGLHLFDVNIALGNLVRTVAIEASNYTG